MAQYVKGIILCRYMQMASSLSKAIKQQGLSIVAVSNCNEKNLNGLNLIP